MRKSTKLVILFLNKKGKYQCYCLASYYFFSFFLFSAVLFTLRKIIFPGVCDHHIQQYDVRNMFSFSFPWIDRNFE